MAHGRVKKGHALSEKDYEKNFSILRLSFLNAPFDFMKRNLSLDLKFCFNN
jgi:hypothetical protein